MLTPSLFGLPVMSKPSTRPAPCVEKPAPNRHEAPEIGAEKVNAVRPFALPNGEAEVALVMEPGAWWVVRLTRDGDGWKYAGGPVEVTRGKSEKLTAPAQSGSVGLNPGSNTDDATTARDAACALVQLLSECGDDLTQALRDLAACQRRLYVAQGGLL